MGHALDVALMQDFDCDELADCITSSHNDNVWTLADDHSNGRTSVVKTLCILWTDVRLCCHSDSSLVVVNSIVVFGSLELTNIMATIAATNCQW